MPYVIPRPRRLLAAMAAAAGALFALAAPASAATTTAPAVCVTPKFSQIFLPVEGQRPIHLVARRQLRDGHARLEPGRRRPDGGRQRVLLCGGAAHRTSLGVPVSGAAVSAPMCIDRTYPSFRFFARNTGLATSTLQVEVLWQESGVTKRVQGRARQEGRDVVDAGQVAEAALGRPQHGRLEPVTFRFTAVGAGGAWQIDDLHGDPYCAASRIGGSPVRPARRFPSIVGRVFDSLAEKLQGTLSGVRQRGALTDDDIKAAMREIRLALLEADVNFKVVKQFTSSVRERAEGVEVTRQLNPGQQVVKIVNEELTALMGGQSAGLTFSPRPPTVILMAGLQGSGKTTATAKLAKYLKEEHKSSVAVAACDVYRPAAVEQLVKVAGQAGATVYEQGTDRDPVDIAAWALDQAKRDGKDVLIIDTSGRLHVDEALMEELARIRKITRPHVVLLVVDAMTGQDAVNVAEQFAEVAQFDGVVLSKLDGDARGGAALSVKAVTGKPILFASTGEKLGDFERFHPDRMAQRILGMGDVLSFIEKAERSFEEDEAADLERKLRKNQFGLDDFLDQLKRIRKMGPLTSLLGMIPGLAGHQLSKMQVDEKEFDRIEAIIHSMTPYERRHPELIKGSRRLRIAKGSGTTVQQVNQLVKQFGEMRKMMKGLQSGKMPDLGQMMRNR